MAPCNLLSACIAACQHGEQRCGAQLCAWLPFAVHKVFQALWLWHEKQPMPEPARLLGWRFCLPSFLLDLERSCMTVHIPDLPAAMQAGLTRP